MSLYDEQTAVIDYKVMLEDIRRNRQLMKARATVAERIELGDRSDLAYWNGGYWYPVAIPGAPIPVFYRVRFLDGTKGNSRRWDYLDGLTRSSNRHASEYFDRETLSMLKGGKVGIDIGKVRRLARRYAK